MVENTAPQNMNWPAFYGNAADTATNAMTFIYATTTTNTTGTNGWHPWHEIQLEDGETEESLRVQTLKRMLAKEEPSTIVTYAR